MRMKTRRRKAAEALEKYSLLFERAVLVLLLNDFYGLLSLGNVIY